MLIVLAVLLSVWLLVLIGAAVLCLRAPRGEERLVEGRLEIRRFPHRS